MTTDALLEATDVATIRRERVVAMARAARLALAESEIALAVALEGDDLDLLVATAAENAELHLASALLEAKLLEEAS